jgi:RNA polymerase sigma factor (sigma-70 family)
MQDMGTIAMTDAELVEASRRGERDAFGQLVTRYQDVVCAVSYSGTGNWALSEDVAQDTFIAAWRQLGQLRETNRLRAWLCQIARNLARKARQKGDRAREDAIEVDSDLVARDVDPFSATAQAEVDRVVREALARIPDRYRETLVLYYCENQSVREVATTLGIAEDAAMQRLSRGRRYLADGVNALVERSLTRASETRGRKDLRMAVMAALPHVDPPSASTGSTSMMKLAIAAAVATAVVGTTAVVAVTRNDDTKPAASAPSATPVARTTGSVPTHAIAPPSIPPAAAAADEEQLPPGAIRVEDNPDVISKATLARLGLDRGPSRGPDNAPVTIVVFQDLMCKYCSVVLGTIDQVFDEYPGKLRVVVKQFPVHKEAVLAAEASLAADAQGKFWELHDVMMANQEDLSRDAIVAYAKQAGLDDKKIAAALDNHTYKDDLKKEVDAAVEVGVKATPEFLINGKDFTGARPIESFRAEIDAALAEAAKQP